MKLIETLDGLGSFVRSVAFSPDGSKIVAGCEVTGQVIVWE